MEIVAKLVLKDFNKLILVVLLCVSLLVVLKGVSSVVAVIVAISVLLIELA